MFDRVFSVLVDEKDFIPNELFSNQAYLDAWHEKADGSSSAAMVAEYLSTNPDPAGSANSNTSLYHYFVSIDLVPYTWVFENSSSSPSYSNESDTILDNGGQTDTKKSSSGGWFKNKFGWGPK